MNSAPKFLYDEKGSNLFDAICESTEYYPTRTEMQILILLNFNTMQKKPVLWKKMYGQIRINYSVSTILRYTNPKYNY